MRTARDVNWLYVDFATFSLNDYYADIPFIKIAAHCVRLSNCSVSSLFEGEYEKNGKKHLVQVDIDLNDCRVDGKYYNPETFIALFDGEDVDPVPIIKELTGIDHEDYCTEVEYSDGSIELLEEKGKCLLLNHVNK